MKSGSIFILVFLFFLSAFNGSCEKDDLSSGTENQLIKESITKLISKNDVPGMIAAIVDSNGVKFIESDGVRNINSSEKITPNDLFHIGSCTKAMTSTMLITLINEGKLKWETTIIDVFPELEGIINKDYYNVTLHQLMTHTSGIKSNATDWWLFQDLEIKERRLALLKANLQEPREFNTGEFNYSNLGYMIAGSMAERVTGLIWEQLMVDRLFNPLGMNSAGFGVPGKIGEVDQPWGHYKSEKNWLPIQSDNSEALGPAGTIHCSFEDWAKYIFIFLKQGNNSIINKKLLEESVVPVGEYACGWGVVEREWANGSALTHSGSNTMWFVTAWVAPKKNRAYIVGTNSCDNNSATLCDEMVGTLIGIE